MKQLLYIVLAAACFSMAGCSNDDEPSIPQTSPDDFESADGQLVIQLGAESSAQTTITRSVINGTNITSLDDLGIFALNRNVSTYTTDEASNWERSTTKNILLWNVIAKGQDLDPYDADVNGGKKVYLYKNSEEATAGRASVYYYPMQGNQNYNFYGYFPRQEGTPAIEGGKAVVNFNNVDGSEDIIVGAAPPAPTVAESQLYTTLNGGAPQLSTSEAQLNGYNSKYIRKIKYHNWLIDTNPSLQNPKKPFVPNIAFTHKTALLYFQVITAGDQAGGDNPPYNDRTEAMNLRVSDLIISMKTKAKLDVVSSTVSWNGDESAVTVQKASEGDSDVWDGEKIKPQEYDANKSSAQAQNATYKSCGYMLVEPKNGTTGSPATYTITLKVHAPSGSNGIPETQDITLTLKAPGAGSFEAGKSYNVRIALYALQKVLIEGSLADWQTGENIDAPIE